MNDTTYMPVSDNTDQTEPQAQRGVRVVHLVFGVLFLGIAAIWALAASDVIQFDVSVGVVLPAVLILAGTAGLVAMLANAARSRRRAQKSYDS